MLKSYLFHKNYTMNTNQWSFTWNLGRRVSGIPTVMEEIVRGFYLDEFNVKKTCTYRGKEYAIELRPGGVQGAGFCIYATRLDDMKDILITPHFVSLPEAMICNVTFAKKRSYKKNGSSSKSEGDESTEGSAMESD